MSKKNRKSIPKEIRRKLLVFSRHECCICNNRIGRNEIHHINGDPSDNQEDNLIPLCPNCHTQADNRIFEKKELLLYKEAKFKDVGIEKLIETKDFTNLFSYKLNEIIKSLKKDQYDPTLSDKIDELIMLLKKQIENWDIPSVRFGTKELFLKLYPYSGDGNKLIDLYHIYKDLFMLAYTQRKRILGTMIDVFFSIWIDTWTSDYEIEKAEKCCDLLLKLGIDFLDKDLMIAKDCFYQIDNAAGDMFKPEILSREILFGAIVEKRKNENEEFAELNDTIVDYISWNNRYSHDDEKFDYLICGIEYAEGIQDNYNIDVTSFKENYLLRILEEDKLEEINGFIEFIEENAYETDSSINTDLQFEAELLELIISSYERLSLNICHEILIEIENRKDQNLKDNFDEIINYNKNLNDRFKPLLKR